MTMMKMTDKTVDDKKGGYGRWKGCVDQIFALKIKVDKYFGKYGKLYAAFMQMKKADCRSQGKDSLSILRVYGMGGRIMEKV